MKDAIQCRFDPPDFFRPGTKVWVIHCRSRAIQEGEVLGVRFEMWGTDPDGAILLGFTGYRLNLYYRNRSDAYFPLQAVYGTREEAELVKEYRDMMRLSPIDKWRVNGQNWPEFNERRLFLIDKEHREGGLAPEETQELEYLQELAGVRRGRHDWGMYFAFGAFGTNPRKGEAMSREQDVEKLRSDVESGMPPVVAVYPIVARGVFGPPPVEILEQTRGGVGHFYYVYLMVLYVVTCFGWLPIPSDHVVQGFLIDYLGYHQGNWLGVALLLLLLVKVAIAIVLRVLLFPVGPDGRADWRWTRWRK